MNTYRWYPSSLPVETREFLEAYPDQDIAEKYLQYWKRQTDKVRFGGDLTWKDRGQSAVYRAEGRFMMAYRAEGHTMLKFDNIQMAQDYANRVAVKMGKTPVEIRPMVRRRRASGVAFWSHIELSKYGMNEYILLHELAHHYGAMNHGRGFRKVLLDMVEMFMGEEARTLLKSKFDQLNLKTTKKAKPKPPATFDQWLIKYQWIQKARSNNPKLKALLA